jgi:hypothetical protein
MIFAMMSAVMVRREERQAVMGWVVGREILIFSFGIKAENK